MRTKGQQEVNKGESRMRDIQNIVDGAHATLLVDAAGLVGLLTVFVVALYLPSVL
jgi:hypothetical protein